MSDYEFSGAMYEPEEDYDRLSGQIGRVLACLLDNTHRHLTVREISNIINTPDQHYAPENSIQAQVRNLRKQPNGGWLIASRYREGMRVAEYQIQGRRTEQPTTIEQSEMFT